MNTKINRNKIFMEQFNENISNDSINKKVCVFGQGFVGLPLTLSFAFRGCNTVGVDVDKHLVEQVNDGITHHTEQFEGVSIQDILNIELEEKRYVATTNGNKAVRDCDNIIVTVGIPIKDGKYIIEYLKDACTTIGKNLKKGDLVIIRSTVIPGTTEGLCLKTLEEESGMKAGTDFYLAYASERIAEGLAFDEFANMPTLVGGINQESLERAVDLLKIVCKANVIPASNIKVVETSKVFENVQRDVNIAMSQEFARFTEALGIDIFEVVKLANTHKRVNLLTPGPGVGGYCIPNAYHYISPKASELNVSMDVLKLAREKNAKLPNFIVNTLENILNNNDKKINECKIAIYGLAMKDYSNDDRISPPIDICKLLIEKGAKVKAFDPIVPTKYAFKVDTQEEALKDADVLMVLTKQNEMQFNNIDEIVNRMNSNPIIMDTKAAIDKEKIKKHNITYWRI